MCRVHVPSTRNRNFTSVVEQRPRRQSARKFHGPLLITWANAEADVNYSLESRLVNNAVGDSSHKPTKERGLCSSRSVTER